MAQTVEFGIYLPQIQLEYETIVARARLIEELEFASMWFYDHLYGPGLPDRPALEPWTLATSVLAHTTTLRVGHLVLCNNFRHPALLAKMATTLDVISGGRLDVGIGSGSYQPEHDQAGLPWGSLAERSSRLGEALEIITSMFAGETTTFSGSHYSVRDLPNLPPPVQQPRPPIHIGGAGEQHTLPLVARYADVWNVPTYALADWTRRRDALHRACDAIDRDPDEIRLSHEAVLVLAPDDEALGAATSTAERRFGAPGFGLHEGGYVGTPAAIVDHIGARVDEGITLFVFFTHDRAGEDTLHLLAEDVVPAFR